MWEEHDRRAGRRLTRTVLTAVVVLLGFFWVLGKVDLPSTSKVTAHTLGPTPCDVTTGTNCVHPFATTTTVRTASSSTTTRAPTYGPDNPADVLLIVDGHVTRLARNQATDAVVAWLVARGVH